MPKIISGASPSTALQGPAEVRVEKLVYGGDGLARLNGQVMLVPFVLPGELISVQTERSKGKMLRASSVEVLEPSPGRVIPRCEYFLTCGGCQYQHSAYELQLEQKQAILRETLQRLGGLTYDGDIPVISGPAWEYRNRVQLHFDHESAGFYRAGSTELCAITHCEISSPVLVKAILLLQEAANDKRWPRFLRSLELFTNGRELQVTVLDSARPVAAKFFEWLQSFLPTFAPGTIEYAAAGHNFRISRGSFFQVNRFLTDTLVEEAVGAESGDLAMDLYAGVGLFSLPLAQKYRRVHAVERGGPAFHDLQWNAQAFPHLTATRGGTADVLRATGETLDLIIADPPRAGLDREVTEQLLRILPPALTIVSCDPATLSRDLKNLLAAYAIERVALVDLFPQTFHFETVVHLRRN